jgi:hypothetical protein
MLVCLRTQLALRASRAIYDYAVVELEETVLWVCRNLIGLVTELMFIIGILVECMRSRLWAMGLRNALAIIGIDFCYWWLRTKVAKTKKYHSRAD